MILQRSFFKLFILLTIPLLTSSFLHSSEPELDSGKILFLLNSGNLRAAFSLYNRYNKESGVHNLELVKEMGLSLLEQGRRSKDLETQLFTLLGAGISGNEKVLYILEEGIKSANLSIQQIAITLLSGMQNDKAAALINYAMHSNSLQIRLEALFHLIKNHNPKAPSQIEALMQKVPREVLPLFPQLLAISGDNNSIKILQKLFTNPLESVRIEAILSTAKCGRDDLLPEIRRLSRHLNVGQQEASAFALGELKDEVSIPRLYELSKSASPTVKIAALFSLFTLGRENAKESIEKLAEKGNLYAIYQLGQMPGSEKTLKSLVHSKDINIRINAGVALLKLHQKECLPVLKEILLKDQRDLAFIPQLSYGKSLLFWKAIPSAKQNLSKDPLKLEISLQIREEALIEALQLEDGLFLTLADHIFKSNQNDLIPTLCKLLVNLQTTEAIGLLKAHKNQVGAPLIRNYCTLSLFCLQEEGFYGEELQEWILSHKNQEMIQFRPFVPWELRSQDSSYYNLTPGDMSRLLVEAFEAFVKTQHDDAIDLLMKVIRDGNDKSKYVLAGLLIRATE